MDWRHRAACQGVDQELFFPVGTSGPALSQMAEAKAVCNRCPVCSQCLNWAVESGQEAGIWGGLNEAERRARARAIRVGPRRSEPSEPHSASTGAWEESAEIRSWARSRGFAVPNRGPVPRYALDAFYEWAATAVVGARSKSRRDSQDRTRGRGLKKTNATRDGVPLSSEIRS